MTPADRLRGADWLAEPELQQLFSLYRDAGFEIRAVGGAVRNTLLGRPVADVDLATSATPEEGMALAEAAGVKAVPVGIAHGTIMIVVGERPFEVTTLREDVETDGRRAKVAYTDDWAADARRRDFTINALYATADGELFDPLDGAGDIETRRIRFIGDAEERIREDYLRILRFFRFNADIGSLPVDEEGLAACGRQRAGLATLSADRVRGELFRLLTAGQAVAVTRIMADHGFLVPVLGGVSYLGRFERLVADDLAADRKPDPVLRLAALGLGVSEDAERLAKRLNLSNRDADRLAAASGFKMFAGRIAMQEAREILYRKGPAVYRDLCQLSAAETGAALTSEIRKLPDTWSAPEFPLKGRDLVEIGVGEGPRIGAILDAVEARWIDTGFALDHDALLAAARQLHEADKGT